MSDLTLELCPLDNQPEMYTVEPPNNGRVGTSHLVHYKEDFEKNMGKVTSRIVKHVYYSEVICIVSFIQSVLHWNIV